MKISMKGSLRLWRETYKTLVLLWLVYIVLIVMGAFFISSVARSYLDKSAESVLSKLQERVTSDLIESEIALRSASIHIQHLLAIGGDADDMREFFKEFNSYVLGEDRRITGVVGLYGLFHMFGGMFIDGSENAATRDYFAHLDKPWYKEAIDAKGGIVITSPHFDDDVGDWKITFSRQFTNAKGKTLAVIGLDMHLSAISKYFVGTQLAEGGYCLMIDRELNIIAATNKEIIGQPLNVLKSPDIYRIIGMLSKGENLNGFKTAGIGNGGKAVTVYTRQMECGWHVGIFTPIGRYYKEIYDKGAMIIIWGIVFQLTISLIVLRVAVAKLKSEDKSKQKSNFLANMSHEIRTPMNAIIGFAELALREDIPPTAYEHIFTIKQAGANLLSIINDILDYSKIESGKMDIVTGEYLFASLVNDVVSIIKMRASYSRLRFVVNIDCNIPYALVGDEIKVRQILLNLLSNAVKYTEKGFVALNITGRTSETLADTTVITIEITDSGKGIKKEDIDKLFKDFVQVDKLKNKGIEGTGLGLVITNNMIKAMNGTITVESEYGKGCIFTVTLPQKIGDMRKHAEVRDCASKNVLVYERRDIYANSIVDTLTNLGVNCANVTSESEFEEKVKDKRYHFVFTAPIHCENAKRMLMESGSNAKLVLLIEFGDTVPDINATIVTMPTYSVTMANILNGVSGVSHGAKKDSFAKFIAPNAKILIVDDTNTNLRVAEGLLAPYKMRIETRKSGAEAILAVQSETYDIVFMDHMMPDMDGLEATRIIRDIGGEYYRKLPIIALTANAVSGAREMFLSEGFNDFISKPIEIGKLNAVLDKWIPEEKRESDGALFECKNGSESVAAEISIDGVDVKKGITLSGGNGAYYLRALGMFYDDGFEKIEEIKRCLDMSDLHLYATHVHGLKSAAASIGADSISEFAKNLETAAKDKNMIYVGERTSKFLLDLESLLRNIGGTLNALTPQKNDAVNLEALMHELIKLKNAIDAFDSEGIENAVEALRKYEKSDDFGGEIKSMLQNVLIGEYDAVLASVEELLRRLK